MFKFYLTKFCNYETEWSVSTVIHYMALYFTISLTFSLPQGISTISSVMVCIFYSHLANKETKVSEVAI